MGSYKNYDTSGRPSSTDSYFNKETNLSSYSSVPNVSKTSYESPFKDLMDNPTDLRIKTSDGVTLIAHRCILEAKSSVLRKLLQVKCKEDSIGSYVEIKDVNANTFSTILTWLYFEELHFNIKTVESMNQVQLAAKKYRLDDLCCRIKEEKRLMSHHSTSFIYRFLTSVLPQGLF